MLTSVRLTNFKSFRESHVPLAPFTLIVGANGAGKSNFFDALRLLHYVSEGSSIRDAIEGHTALDPSVTAVPEVRGGAAGIPHYLSESSVFRIAVDIST